ncbi:S24 family peptidase, partial [Parabacteroides distasonis]
KFDVDPSWLMTGEGNKKKVVEAIPIDVNCILNVPLVNQYAYAGYLCGYADAEYIETLPTIPFIVDHEAHGHYIAFEVRGDSMNDGTEESYLEGDRLLCREIKRELWIDSKLHIRKWDFVIVHKEGVLIKRIVEHNVENGTITVHSLNPIYPDKVISLAEVYQIFNVIEFLRPRRR